MSGAFNINKETWNLFLYWGVFIFVSLCFTFCFFVFPYSVDDWWYLSEILYQGSDADGHHTLAEGLKQTLISHYSGDTSRLGNTIGALLLVVPKWIPSAISSAAFIISYWLLAVLGGIRPGQTARLIWLSFFFVFGIMWQEHMFSQMFAFNYVVTSALFLGCFCLFLDKRKHNAFLCGFLALVLGTFHESFAIVFLGCGFLLVVLKPRMRTLSRIVMLVCVTAGLLWIFGFSSFLVRTSGHIAGHIRVSHPFFMYLWFAVIIGYVVCLCKKKWRPLCSDPLIVSSFFAGFIVIPFLLVANAPRATMSALLLACCALVIMMTDWWPRVMRFDSLRGIMISFIAFSVMAFHLNALCRASYRLRLKIDETVRIAANINSREETLFVPVIYPWDDAWILVTRPDQELLAPNCWAFQSMKLYVNRPQLPYPVPAELRYYRRGEGEPIEGSEDFRIWNGHIVSADTTHNEIVHGVVDYGLISADSKIYRIPFTTADGEKFTYILPIRSRVTFFTGAPTKIEIQ